MVRGQNEAAPGGRTHGALEVRERATNAATFVLVRILGGQRTFRRQRRSFRGGGAANPVLFRNRLAERQKSLLASSFRLFRHPLRQTG